MAICDLCLLVNYWLLHTIRDGVRSSIASEQEQRAIEVLTLTLRQTV